MAASTPILLIHGFPLDGSMWEPQEAALTAKGYQVHAPDLPGFGSSGAAPWPKDRYTMESLADEVHGLIQSLPGKQAVVGGFSMGGYILLSLLRDHPESVQAAMIIDSRAEADTPEARANRLKSIEDVAAHGVPALADALLPRLVSKQASPELREKVRSIIVRQHPQAVIGAQWAMARRSDHTDLLATLTIPLLLIVGADDMITPPSVAMMIHNHCPHAMLVQIARAGHMAPLEQPESVSQAIDTFMHTLGE